jgi:phosphate transport system protein
MGLILRPPIVPPRLIWVTHHLERVADQAMTIYKPVVFLVAGKMEEIRVSKY